jgi:hypothetical protein
MKTVADLLKAMIEAGAIETYAIFGAMAQMRYTEPVATLDAGVLVVLGVDQGLDLLAPIHEFCRTRGYEPQDEAVMVGTWPVQFIPVFSALTREAVELAETVDFEGSPLRVIRASHLAVIALSVGRAKDYARIIALIESGSVTPKEIEALAVRHQLSDAWQRFKRRFLDE